MTPTPEQIAEETVEKWVLKGHTHDKLKEYVASALQSYGEACAVDMRLRCAREIERLTEGTEWVDLADDLLSLPPLIQEKKGESRD